MVEEKKPRRSRREAVPAEPSRSASGRVPRKTMKTRRLTNAERAERTERTGKKDAAPANPGAPSTLTPAPPATASPGEVSFTPDIITQIAGREVSDVEDVAELTGGWRTKGVQVTEPVEGEDEGYLLDIRIAVEYGVNCLALAETIRGRVSGVIEHMTGRKARAINVHVTGIREKGLREEPHEESAPLGEEHGIDF